MFKVLAIFFAVLLLWGCKAGKTITVRLHSSDDNGQQLAAATYLLWNVHPDSLQLVLAKNLNLDSFIISVFDCLPQQREMSEKINLNNSIQKADILDAKIIFFTGLKNDSIFLIADANNNNRLDDDKILSLKKNVLESQSIKDLEKFPKVSIHNLQTVYEGHIYTFSKRFYLQPDTIRTGELTLNVISNEQMMGQFKYKGDKYYVRAKQMSSGSFITDPKSVIMRIDTIKNLSKIKYNRNAMAHLYDTIKTGKRIFTIQKVTPFLNKIFIKSIPN